MLKPRPRVCRFESHRRYCVEQDTHPLLSNGSTYRLLQNLVPYGNAISQHSVISLECVQSFITHVRTVLNVSYAYAAAGNERVRKDY